MTRGKLSKILGFLAVSTKIAFAFCLVIIGVVGGIISITGIFIKLHILLAIPLAFVAAVLGVAFCRLGVHLLDELGM